MVSGKRKARLRKSRVLNVGLDDSNHAGQVKGEINLGVFSLDEIDGRSRHWSSMRDQAYIDKFLISPLVDYRFTLLMHEAAAHCVFNLALVAPYLIEGYLGRNQELRDNLRLINLSIDGLLNPNIKRRLGEEISDKYKVTTNLRTHFRETKKYCPPVLYVADAFANRLFHNSTSGTLQSSKLVIIPGDYLARRARTLDKLRGKS